MVVLFTRLYKDARLAKHKKIMVIYYV